MNLHTIINWIEALPEHYFWLFEVTIVLVVTLLVSLTHSLLYKWIKPHFEKTNKIWDDAFLESLYVPLFFLIWLLGITYAADLARAANRSWRILYAIDPIRHVGIVLFVVWFSTRFIARISTRLVHPDYKKHPLDKTTVDAASKLLTLIVGGIALIIVLQEFGIHVSGLLAFVGGGAFILGFGAKDMLANLFGGLIVYLDRPFAVGEWILIQDKNIEGTVEYIGWRLTRIRTFDRRPLYVPNSIFNTYAIENPSRMTNRRIKTTFGLRYCDADKVNDITADIENMLRDHPAIDTRQTIFVKLIEFAPSYLTHQIYCFTKTTQWVKFQAIQQDVFIKIIEIVTKHGAQMAFPTRTLDISPPHAYDVRQAHFELGKDYD